MADRRYKNGVFVGNGTKAQARWARIEAILHRNSPERHGWKFDYVNKNYDESMYSLLHFKIMAHPNKNKTGYIVFDTLTDQQYHYEGPLDYITKDVLQMAQPLCKALSNCFI
ncbi:MAG: hypothetical protein GY928_08470 [Colwellia sp.]|nr:hypothetical protein [Colwellia sp.]